MNRRCNLFILLLFLSPCAAAQQKWFELTGGFGFTTASTSNSTVSYDSRILPTGGLTVHIPIVGRLALRSGILYQQKGLRGGGSVADSLEVHSDLSSRETYHYLNIPLQLDVAFAGHKNGVWRIAGGMSYGILVDAVKSIRFRTYDGGSLVGEYEKEFKQSIGIESSQNYPGLPGQEGTALYVFTPAIRLDLTWQYKKQFVLGLHYEQHLQDIRMRVHNNARQKLHSVGIMAGVIIR